jgi:ankyrin repeat protein
LRISASADIRTRALKDTPALHFAAANNHAAVVRAMIELGADANATTPLGRNAMDWAYYSNQSAAVLGLGLRV